MFVRNNRIRTFLSIEHTQKKMCMKISSTRVKKTTKKRIDDSTASERKTKGIKNCLGLFFFIKLKNKKVNTNIYFSFCFALVVMILGWEAYLPLKYIHLYNKKHTSACEKRDFNNFN